MELNIKAHEELAKVEKKFNLSLVVLEGQTLVKELSLLTQREVALVAMLALGRS